MGNKVELSVLGFSFNQTKTGAYGLVLAEEDGLRRLMVVVGTSEAQSIAFELQGSRPPRPLTHDLFRALLSAYEITLLEVNIYKFEDGVFFSRLSLLKEGNVIYLESRTSDAVSIALRTQSPIYTTEEIMQQEAVVFDERVSKHENNVGNELDIPFDYSLLNQEELETMLKDAIAGEDYELASLLRDELVKKKDK